jgi:hypothetical protein
MFLGDSLSVVVFRIEVTPAGPSKRVTSRNSYNKYVI